MAEEAPKGGETPPEGSPPPEGAPGEPGAPSDEVQKLKDENAERRIKAKELEEKNTAMAQRLLDTTVASVCKDLADAADLLHFTKVEDLMGEDGLPDQGKILLAEADLIKLKPHLKSRIPRSTIDQGPRGEEVESFSFNDWIKDAAG